MVYKRKKYHREDTHLKKRWMTKRRTKDLDQVTLRFIKVIKSSYGNVLLQIDHDLNENAEKLLNQETDLDKPGQAQFYCIHCARYFIDDQALQDHFRTKVKYSIMNMFIYLIIYNTLH